MSEIISFILGGIVVYCIMWVKYNVERPKHKGYWEKVEESNSTL